MGIGRKLFGSLYDSWKALQKQREFEHNFYDKRVDIIEQEWMDTDKLVEELYLFDVEVPAAGSFKSVKLKPMDMTMTNKKEVLATLDQWIAIRKEKNLETEDLRDGIQLFIEYGLFFDELQKLLISFMKGEEILLSFMKSEEILLYPDSNHILQELLHCSYCSINMESALGMYEAYIEEDIEQFFETSLKLKLDIIGLSDLQFKSEAEKNGEEFIYKITITVGENSISYKCSSDTDVLEPIFAFLNYILIQVGSTKRFYNMGGYKSLLDIKMVPTLMKRHEILVFK